MSFAYVEFVSDHQNEIVPTTFLKNFSPEDAKPGAVYPCFWSSNPTDTPDSILFTQGKVLEVDRLPELKKRKSTKNLAPVAGYYDAKILLIADSEEEVEELLTAKRVPKPSVKLVNMQNSSKVMAKPLTKAGKNKILKNAEALNIQKLRGKYFSSDESNSDEDQLTPRKPYLKKIKEAKEQVEIYKDKYLTVLEKNLELRAECEKLSKRTKTVKKLFPDQVAKCLPPQSSKENEECTAAAKPQHAASPKIENEIVAKCLPPQSSKENEECTAAAKPQHAASPKIENEIVAKCLPPQSSKENEACTASAKPQHAASPMIENEIENSDGGGGDLQPCSEEPSINGYFESADGLQRKLLWRVKPGELGDSQFTKNLSAAIFGNRVLMESSVDGQAHPGNKKLYPALDPELLENLKALCRKRMEEENPKPSKEQKLKRLSLVESFVSDKIQTLRRPSRASTSKTSD